MKEFIQSLFETSNERIKNPFVGSYIVAFIVYNWRTFLFLIFSDSKIEDKIVVINHEYCKKEALLWPLGIALFYILILPYLNLLFDYLLSVSNQKKEDRKNENIINSLKNKKDQAKFEREIAEERAGTSEISELKNQIERLTSENELLSKQQNENFERYNKSLENSKKEEDNIRKLYESLLEKYENEKNSIGNYVKENQKFLKTYLNTNLNLNEQNYYVRFYRFINGMENSIEVNDDIRNKFAKLSLLVVDESSKFGYTITNIGEEAYRILSNN